MSKILIVEDREDPREILVHIVNATGREIHQAKNEFEAIELLMNEEFDLIVVDLNLEVAGGSNRGGLEVIAAAKQKDTSTQVIAITYYPAEVEVAEIMKWGGFFLDRSNNRVNFRDLLAGTVEIALRLRNLQRNEPKTCRITFGLENGQRIRVQMEGAHTLRGTSEEPLSLNIEQLKQVSSAVGPLVQNAALDGYKILTRFIGEILWKQIVASNEILLGAFRIGQALVDPTRLTLRFDTSRTYLDIPLELLHTGNEQLARRHPLIRRIDYPFMKPNKKSFKRVVEDLRTEGKPLRILLVASDTHDAARRLHDIPSVDAEIEELKEFLKGLSTKVRLDVKQLLTDSATLDSFVDELGHEGGYHILHYAGHSDYNPDQPDKSNLYFWRDENRRGGVAPLDASSFAQKLQSTRTAFVFLNSCVTAMTGTDFHLASRECIGTMDALLEGGMPAVLGHRWPVWDVSAQPFVTTFYQQLLATLSFEQAILAARQSVRIDDPRALSTVMVVQNE